MLLRYQDRHGRGPFRFGVPALWADEDADNRPSVFERFPSLEDALPRLRASGAHVGCAVVGWTGLNRYFTKAEQERLHALGYRVHRAPNNSVVMQDDIEAVIALRRPFKTLPRAHKKEPDQ